MTTSLDPTTLRRYADALPAEERAVIACLCGLDGQRATAKVAEIAKDLGIHRPKVIDRRARALRFLRAAMDIDPAVQDAMIVEGLMVSEMRRKVEAAEGTEQGYRVPMTTGTSDFVRSGAIVTMPPNGLPHAAHAVTAIDEETA